MSKGLFGNLFDLNRDGELSNFERTVDFVAYNSMIKEHQKNEERSYEYWYDEEDEIPEIVITGVSEEVWAMFDEDDRREILLREGFNPDDYDLMSLKVKK